MLLKCGLEKTLESSLDCKEIKPVNPKGNQSWIFTGRTDAELPVLWLPDEKGCLTGKDPNAGNDWRQEEKGMTEDEMFGWHHWLSSMSLSKLQEMVKDRVDCNPRDHEESDMTEWLNNKNTSPARRNRPIRNFSLILYWCCIEFLNPHDYTS